MILLLGITFPALVSEPGAVLPTWAWCLGYVVHCTQQPVTVQGTRMLGRMGEGVPMEGAPESLVERVVSFLAQTRAVMRSARAQASGHKPGGARLMAPVFWPASPNKLTPS